MLGQIAVQRDYGLAWTGMDWGGGGVLVRHGSMNAAKVPMIVKSSLA